MRDVCHGIVLRSLRSPRGGTFCFRTSNAIFLQDINMKVSEASSCYHHTGLRTRTGPRGLSLDSPATPMGVRDR
jgi:hypothetical protein